MASLNFGVYKARNWYKRVFKEPIDEKALGAALAMSEEEFEAAVPGVDPESGEYLPSPFSAGEWDAINYARK